MLLCSYTLAYIRGNRFLYRSTIMQRQSTEGGSSSSLLLLLWITFIIILLVVQNGYKIFSLLAKPILVFNYYCFFLSFDFYLNTYNAFIYIYILYHHWQ